MENIKFIREMTNPCKTPHIEVGNCIFFPLENGNIIKAYCSTDSSAVTLEVLNKSKERLDKTDLPFNRYFAPTKCSENAPLWYQHIDNGKWWFSEMYTHVLPKPADYKRIAEGIETYIALWN